MPPTIAAEAPPLRVDETGTIRVANTRITLDVLIAFFLQGASPESISDGFPSLTLADVYAAIAYYLQHRDEIDAYLAKREREADELKAKFESDPRNKLSRERLLARARERGLRP